MSFVKGGLVGKGNEIGFDEDEEIRLAEFGFSKLDRLKMTEKWLEIYEVKELNRIFEKFKEEKEDDIKS